ncbi:hypothetical protein C8T65DRAFT_238274 [Cerioporus squamosus]|nr:hypothetical protein C8T65DRAFT_238274 [Cerioporus squamosus]
MRSPATYELPDGAAASVTCVRTIKTVRTVVLESAAMVRTARYATTPLQSLLNLPLSDATTACSFSRLATSFFPVLPPHLCLCSPAPPYTSCRDGSASRLLTGARTLCVPNECEPPPVSSARTHLRPTLRHRPQRLERRVGDRAARTGARLPCVLPVSPSRPPQPPRLASTARMGPEASALPAHRKLWTPSRFFRPCRAATRRRPSELGLRSGCVMREPRATQAAGCAAGRTAQVDNGGRWWCRLPAGGSPEVLAICSPPVLFSVAAVLPARLGAPTRRPRYLDVRAPSFDSAVYAPSHIFRLPLSSLLPGLSVSARSLFILRGSQTLCSARMCKL